MSVVCENVPKSDRRPHPVARLTREESEFLERSEATGVGLRHRLVRRRDQDAGDVDTGLDRRLELSFDDRTLLAVVSICGFVEISFLR